MVNFDQKCEKLNLRFK